MPTTKTPNRPRRRWTEDAVAAELERVVAETGRMPTRAELAARGLGGLWTAMGRLGGVAAWRRRVVPVERAAVEQRAYFLSLRGDGDPVGHWLEAERQLRAA